jgi:two-component sensor histidine kinase
MDFRTSGGAEISSQIDFQRLFESSPHPYLILRSDPAFTIAAVSEQYLAVTHTRREAIVGRGLFEIFPPNPGAPPAGTENLQVSLERVLRERTQDVMGVQRYDLVHVDGRPIRYWSPVNTPVFDGTGAIPLIIHHVEDVTEFVQMRAPANGQEADRRALRTDRMQAEILLRARELARTNEKLKSAQKTLALRERELAQLNQTLEQRVSERTSELQASNQRLVREMQEKVTLLAEIHHRVKNNLQVISSLLDLQSMQVEDSKVRAMLQNGMHRIQSMALIHQTLYQSKDFARVAFDEVLNTLACNVASSCGIDESRIRLVVDTAPLHLSISMAIPCGLIVNELITNALKHAFPAGRGGVIEVKLREIYANTAELSVSDDGIGLPADATADVSRTLGLELISILTEQLRGTLTIEHANPTCFRISFPMD